MVEHIETEKPLIVPVYSQDRANQSIDLGQVKVRFQCETDVYDKTANVVLEFLPDHRLRFLVPLDRQDLSLTLRLFQNTRGKVSLTLVDRGVDFDAVVSESHANSDLNDCHIVFSPLRSAINVTTPSERIVSATFHVFNFPDFVGPQDYTLRTGNPPLQGMRTCGRAVLRADGWIITIAAADRTEELEKELKDEGGYVITHMGQIVREDGATFTSEKLDEILTCLTYFLSLTLGCWAGVEMPIGFDGSGNRVFERWGLGRTDKGPWESFCSWFHPRHAELLSQVFPGFTLLWKSDLWRTPLAHAIYWYLGACKGGAGSGVDTGVILAQTALELLAWTYCVKDRKMVSPGAFETRRLSASDKLRLLASSTGIPAEIPPGLSALHGRTGKKWEDGIEAIVSIRNSLVHPDSKVSVSDDSYREAYMLSLWFINLVFLRLCDHNGRYANRLPTTSGIVTFDPVPWAKAGSDGV